MNGTVDRAYAKRQLLPLLEQDRVMVLLGAVAGCVDAITFLGLGQVFTANMTGNTVFLGLAISQGQNVEMLRSGIALLGYCLGTVAGALIIRRNRVTVGSTRFIVAIFVEGLLLVILMLLWWVFGNGTSTLNILILLSGLAMGLQSAAVLNLHIADTATTYLSGTITSFFASLVEHAAHQPTSANLQTVPKEHNVKLKAAIWISFALAAGVTGFVEIHLQMWSLLLPLVIIGIVMLNTMTYRRLRTDWSQVAAQS